MTGDSDSLSLHSFYDPNFCSEPFERARRFHDFMLQAQRRGQYAYRRTLLGPSEAHVSVAAEDALTSREMLLFGSNNYLDLANHPHVVAAARAALERYGYGAGSVALLAGTQQVHRDLEQRLAKFYERESAVVFPSGYAANLGAISALLGEKDLALVDLYAHRSLVDGTRLAGCLTKFYAHNDLGQLRRLLERFRSQHENLWIVTDGVFSMDGDLCPLPELLTLAREFAAHLIIDEAHAIGVLGAHGRGTEEHFDKVGQTDVILGTLSKAPAGLGGYLVGSAALVEWVRHFASPYVFSTALPPPTVAGLIAALDVIDHDPERRIRLLDNARYFVRRLRSLGFRIENTESAIVPVILGEERVTRAVARALHEQGIFASAVVFPAVSRTRARIRFSIMSSHSHNDLDRVCDAMQKLGRLHGIVQ